MSAPDTPLTGDALLVAVTGHENALAVVRRLMTLLLAHGARI